jgi:hypothetical protein
VGDRFANSGNHLELGSGEKITLYSRDAAGSWLEFEHDGLGNLLHATVGDSSHLVDCYVKNI